MGTWGYVNVLRAENLEHLRGEGVDVPPLSPHNRAPDKADVRAAWAAVGEPELAELVVDMYREPGGELTVALRGRVDRMLGFLLELARRCGQLHLFPFPYDAVPGAVADPADDLAALLRRLDPETRKAVESALEAERNDRT